MLKKTLLGLAAVIVVLQFFRIDKTNPPIDKSQEFLTIHNPPSEVVSLLKDACYDCHSHETKYPWYTNVAPLSWWIKNHIDEGREHLNFSIWGTYKPKRQAHKLEECYEEVEEQHMPLDSYVWMHPEAKLSDEQRSLLVNWFKARYKNPGKTKADEPLKMKKEAEEI